jgi:transposase
MKRNYPESAERRAMKEREVILKAIAGEIKWVQAADILEVSPRTIRRKYHEFREHGITGLIDRRKGVPSSRRVPYETVETVLKLFRDSYFDFNVKHFHEKLEEIHKIEYSYTWVKALLQEAGYVKRGKGRGGHRKRRERRPLFGQMLHLDGSEHPWLALCPGERQMLLLVVDDATGLNLGGRLVAAETTKDCMSVMRQVVEDFGIPSQLYTDRDSVYWLSRNGKVDRENLTQFGRAMQQLGVEMIPGYSPQARGRSERWNGTWQGRLVAELREQGIDNKQNANQYIEEVFIPDMNHRFSVEPKNKQSAFVSAYGQDLDRIFSILHEDRTVAADNTVRVNGLILQIEPSPYRVSFVKCKVDAFENLDGAYSVVWKGRVIGRYDSLGNHCPSTKEVKKQEGIKFDKIALPPRGQTSTALQTEPDFQRLPEYV